ncbi:hypothetical protein LIER_15021 [Lithospermum erythrorhizon]|uniref:Uncharacterized protein n=1 Tax=Lithospermum erythrorhizon TaxID=34254 RepID=A0AAV3Q2V1_LITER
MILPIWHKYYIFIRYEVPDHDRQKKITERGPQWHLSFINIVVDDLVEVGISVFEVGISEFEVGISVFGSVGESAAGSDATLSSSSPEG